MPAAKPAGVTPAMESFVSSLVAKGEDAQSIVILLETEYPAMMGKKGVLEWIKGKVGR